MSAHERLEIEEDERHERAESGLLLGGRVLLLGFLLAAALGFTGPGWWSSQHVTKEGVAIHYARSIHRRAPADVVLEIDSRFVRDGEVGVWLSGAWLGEVQGEEWRPAPATSRVEPDRTVWTFAAGGAGPVTLRWTSERRSFGSVRGELGVLDGPSFELHQFAFP